MVKFVFVEYTRKLFHLPLLNWQKIINFTADYLFWLSLYGFFLIRVPIYELEYR